MADQPGDAALAAAAPTEEKARKDGALSEKKRGKAAATTDKGAGDEASRRCERIKREILLALSQGRPDFLTVLYNRAGTLKERKEAASKAKFQSAVEAFSARIERALVKCQEKYDNLEKTSNQLHELSVVLRAVNAVVPDDAPELLKVLRDTKECLERIRTVCQKMKELLLWIHLLGKWQARSSEHLSMGYEEIKQKHGERFVWALTELYELCTKDDRSVLTLEDINQISQSVYLGGNDEDATAKAGEASSSGSRAG